MCGISALFSIKPSHTIARQIEEMNRLIAHRGPDDEGYVLFGSLDKEPSVAGGKDTPTNVYEYPSKYAPKNELKHFFGKAHFAALGHRRLSILDLSAAGHQPMCTEDRELWITYNGEVYNYLEIRRELEARGYVFATKTDTEVILKAYREWGDDAFSHMNGMFSFIIYDVLKKSVTAVRDRFGVKPLYYWFAPDGTLAIGSEIKQFTVLDGWQAHLEGQIAYDFLNWGVIDHSDKTFFSGVRQLRGGEYVTFSLSHMHERTLLKPKRWYSLKAKPFMGNLDQASRRFSELLEDSIRLRLRADVDIGSCLSGGLDSSAIVCVTNKLLKMAEAEGSQKTFSACSEIERFCERPFIDTVVNATGVDANYTYPSFDHVFEECKDIIWHQDEPFSSSSIYAQWLVFKMVKEKHVKVMLDGQGADEQLAGYHGFFGNRFYDLCRNLRWKTLYNEIKISGKMHPALRPFPLFANKFVPNALRQPLRKLMCKPATKPEWLNIDVLGAQDRDPYQTGRYKSVADQSTLQICHTSLPMLLHYEDRDSMAHSVESRTPFLDFRLVEFSLGLSSDHKISNGWTKRVLRESMKGVLPEVVRQRIDKMGFLTAEEEWLRKQGVKRFQTELKEVIESSHGIIKPAAMAHLQEIINGKRPFSYLPWRQIMFGYWMRRFKVNFQHL